MHVTSVKLGYSATPANLLTVPVYILACFMTCLMSWLGDRYGHRGYLNLCVTASSPLAQRVTD